MLSPCQDEYEDQELFSYNVDMLCEYEVKFSMEKDDDDAQGMFARPMLVS